MEPLKTRWIGIGLALCALGLATGAQADPQHKTSKHPRKAAVHRKKVTKRTVRNTGHTSLSGAEIELIGIRLFDPQTKVLAVYGSPDDITPVGFTTGNTAGGFGGFGGGGRGGPGGGRPGGPGGGMMPGGKGAGGAGADFDFPFQPGSDTDDFQGPGMSGPPGSPGGYPGAGGQGGYPGAGGRGGPPGGIPGAPGAQGGIPGAAGGGRNGGIPNANGGAAERVQYTRWIYNRNQNKYGFVIDKNGRVVQIEAIGITNPKVHTRRGVGFGTSFATIIERYQNPDGYEISGDNILIKYLNSDKVAFRLSRLGEKKPHTVTGIVVSAGKA